MFGLAKLWQNSRMSCTASADSFGAGGRTGRLVKNVACGQRHSSTAVSVYRIDPVRDRRWTGFLERHPRASVFHCPAWLEALRRTYGYQCVVLTTAEPGAALTNGLPVCRVKSWLLGDRLVSLPFSDHCEPLAERPGDVRELLSFLTREVGGGKWNYAEVRPCDWASVLEGNANGFLATRSYLLHKIDLSATLEELFRRLHKSSVQRKIHRAEREGLAYEAGASEWHLASFYSLLKLTRRRHGVPPQPMAWFRNLIACFGEKATIYIASKDGRPVSSILTLSFKNTMVYKYGCSDVRYHNLGGMPFLFWRAIQEAKNAGMTEFDLGRSDPEQPGLITFKDRLGATRSPLTYYCFPAYRAGLARDGWTQQTAKRVLVHMPEPVLTVAGRLLYKHLG